MRLGTEIPRSGNARCWMQDINGRKAQGEGRRVKKIGYVVDGIGLKV